MHLRCLWKLANEARELRIKTVILKESAKNALANALQEKRVIFQKLEIIMIRLKFQYTGLAINLDVGWQIDVV